MIAFLWARKKIQWLPIETVGGLREICWKFLLGSLSVMVFFELSDPLFLFGTCLVHRDTVYLLSSIDLNKRWIVL